MKKRLMIGLLTGGLVAAMLPGVATAASPYDKVNGSVQDNGQGLGFSFSAKSGPSGESPSGNISMRFTEVGNLTATVDCMIVDGDEAVIGGPFTKGREVAGLSRGYVYVVDNGQPNGAVPDLATGWYGGSGTTCGFDFPRDYASDVLKGNVKVHDAD